MTSDEQNALRMLLREEVNTAVYASEQRLSEHLGRIEERLGHIEERQDRMEERQDRTEERQDRMEERQGRMEERQGRMEEGQDRTNERLDRIEEHQGRIEEHQGRTDERLDRFHFIQTQMAANLAKAATVLDEATIKISELQTSQFALENKLEENITGLRRDMQKLTYSVRSYTDTVTDTVASIRMRLDMHKDTPIDEAHPHSTT